MKNPLSQPRSKGRFAATSPDLAELLLRQVVDPARAAECVGDQLEAHPSASHLRFWLAIARLFFVFSWRTLLGIAISPLSGILLALLAFLIASTQWKSTGTLPGTLAFHVKNYLAGVCALLWAGSAFALIRFGGRQLFPRLSLSASILGSVTLVYFDQPMPAIALTIAWAAFLLFCVLDRRRRQALATLAASIAAAWLVAFALSAISQDPNSVFGKWEFPAALILVPIAESSVVLSLNRKFRRSEVVAS